MTNDFSRSARNGNGGTLTVCAWSRNSGCLLRYSSLNGSELLRKQVSALWTHFSRLFIFFFSPHSASIEAFHPLALHYREPPELVRFQSGQNWACFDNFLRDNMVMMAPALSKSNQLADMRHMILTNWLGISCLQTMGKRSLPLDCRLRVLFGTIKWWFGVVHIESRVLHCSRKWTDKHGIATRDSLKLPLA